MQHVSFKLYKIRVKYKKLINTKSVRTDTECKKIRVIIVVFTNVYVHGLQKYD